MEFIRVTNPSNIWLKPNITSTLRQLGSHVISIPFPPSGSLLYRRPEESGREWRYPAQRWGFLRRSGCRPVYVVWKKVITTPLSAFLVGIFEANRNCRQKRQGSARSSSSQGTGVSKEIRPTATAVPACKREGLRVQRIATVGLHRKYRMLSSRSILARPQELSPLSLLYPPSRSPPQQRHRIDVARLWPVKYCGPARLAARFKPTPVPPRWCTRSLSELRWPGFAGSYHTLSANEREWIGPTRSELGDGSLPPPSCSFLLCQ